MRLPKCEFCKHCHKIDSNGIVYCDAFPDGKLLVEIPEDGDVECAKGVRYEDENGEYKEFTPDPNSILAKMLHWL